MVHAKILIVDDEVAICEMIAVALEMAGFQVLMAHGAPQAHALVVDERPDLLLLDWMMPGVSGVEFARRLRRDDLTAELPIIMLTAKADEDNKIKGLDAGADDYITKPFSTRELISRINAVLRRSNVKAAEKAIDVDGLNLDPISRRISAKGEPINMGPTEFRLLEFFMTHPERAYTRAQLLDQVWGGNVYVEDRTVDVHIRRLRKALSNFNYDGLIQTVRGTGYRFSVKG